MQNRLHVHTRWIVAIYGLCAFPMVGSSSVLRWTTRLGHTNCDDRPVAVIRHPDLRGRSANPDLDASLKFEAERPLASGSTLNLVVCNGEVHLLANSEPGKLKVSVHLSKSLGHELTPGRFLQVFSSDSNRADVEWKLPERVHPVIDIYVPQETNLHLQLGKINLEVKDIRGEKTVNAGKGTVRLAVPIGNADYSSIIVDVAMGSFADLRPGGESSQQVPLHEEISGKGTSTAHLQMAMGRIEIMP